MADIKEVLVGLIADKLGLDPDQVTPESNLVDDLGADSFEVTELAVDIEDQFHIEVSDEEIDKQRTIADWAHLIESKKAA